MVIDGIFFFQTNQVHNKRYIGKSLSSSTDIMYLNLVYKFDGICSQYMYINDVYTSVFQTIR